MTEIAPTIIPPDDLAARINAQHEEVRRALWRGAEAAVEVGKLLLQAKARVGHGNWLEWIGTYCRFSERTAQSYMRLAQELPLQANPQKIAGLSLTGAIQLLEDLKSPEEKPAKLSLGRRTGAKKNPVVDAIKADPLSVLERAWQACGDPERDIFLKRIEKDIGPPARTETTNRPEIAEHNKVPTGITDRRVAKAIEAGSKVAREPDVVPDLAEIKRRC